MSDETAKPADPAPDPLASHEYALGADEIATVGLWSEPKLGAPKNYTQQTLVQSELSKATTFSVQVSATDLPAAMEATLTAEVTGRSQSWDGYLVPAGADQAKFVLDDKGKLPSIDLCKVGFFGKGQVTLTLVTIHGNPATLRLPSDYLLIDNPFDLEVECDGHSRPLSLSQAMGEGSLIAGQVLVGTPVGIKLLKIPEFLKKSKFQFALAAGKPTGPKLLNWKEVGEGDLLLYEGYRVGLEIGRDLHPALATAYTTFDIRAVFQVEDLSGKSKSLVLADIPLANDVPKPFVKDFSWRDHDQGAHQDGLDKFRYNRELFETTTCSSTSAFDLAPSQMASFSERKEISASRVVQADISLLLEKVFPGTRIWFDAYLGFTPQPIEDAREEHYVARLDNPSVRRSPDDENAIRIFGSDQAEPCPIDLRGMRPLFSGLRWEPEKLRNIFVVLDFPVRDAKGTSSDIPFRHMLDVFPSLNQGVVRFSKDRTRVEDSLDPVALGSTGLTGEGTEVKIFSSEKVKYDDAFRPKPLVVVKENGREVVDMGCTVKQYAQRMLASAQTWDPSHGTDGNWRKATLEEVVKAVDPWEGNDASQEIPHKMQFAKLKVSYEIDAGSLETFYRVHGARMGKNGDAFLRIMPGLAKLIVKAAKDCALSPLYCASHCMTEFSTPSVGMPQDGKTYYNFFGIGAFQATQAGVDSARKFAKSRGWDSPEKGMKGGIEFLRDWIYDSADSRENLYDMRWDLKSQRKVYGTAVNWATGAATFMAQIYDLQPKKPEIVLLVPRFKK